MEAFGLPYSPDQTISPCKRNPKKNIQTTTVPRPSSENFSPANLFLNLNGRGILLGPPPPHLSSYSVSNGQKQQHPQPKPPLLPLPINNKSCSRNRGLSCPPTNRRTSKVRNQGLRASSSSVNTPKKQDLRSVSTERLGPEPGDLPKEVSRVMKPYVSFEDINEKFSPSVFYMSPPPSSLPLPKFSVRPKLSCNAEAGGIDAGATDKLRRLLRLM
ncbi:uncharacterized protein LOC122082095 [Macadamia integrifolia]|uniref:uncharacterized protein LOC122082095 n=1 Tax=Macadamia integrifolia TaxID=60698 RepID=UPI001C4EB405|nr:uncharacterized protein LOC122082095 [Macadamia integrifolia]